MPTFPVGPRAGQVWAGQGAVLLANQDLAATVTVGTRQGLAPGDGDCDPIPPLGSIAYAGGRVLYAAAPAGTAGLAVIAGGTSWAPSPADVALQIQALGLATNAAVLAVNSTLGAPAQNSTVAGLASGGTIAQEAQGLGIPPAVPALQSAQRTRQGVTQVSFKTFGSAGRIWRVRLASSVASDNTFTAATPPAQLIHDIETGSGTTLAICEMSISGPNQTVPDGDSGTFNGLPVAQGDTLVLNVNNGVTVSGVVQRASALVLYSIP